MSGARHIDARVGNLPGKLEDIRYATRESIRLRPLEGVAAADHQNALARKAQS